MRSMMRGLVSMLALLGAGAGQTQPVAPSVRVCLRAYSESAQQARYMVTIDWNGMAAGQFQRLDIGARDASDDTWPQLRDNRLRPNSQPAEEFIVVSDVSRYPLRFVLMGFTRAAMDQFDQSCAEGFCSVRLPAEGISQVGEGVNVPSVREAVPCRRAGT